MVLEIGSLAQTPLDLFGPWPRLGSGPNDDDIDSRNPRLPSSLLQQFGPDRHVTRFIQSGSDGTQCLGRISTSPTMTARSLGVASTSSKQQAESCQFSDRPMPNLASQRLRDFPTPKSSFSFTQILSPVGGTFNFRSSRLPIRLNVSKRARPLADVDGENTAPLSCKKRRLRLQLITSRLSQPFSVPASHILNRGTAVSGERRFSKLPTNIESSKRLSSVQSTLLRRAAVLNRVRLRVCHEATERGNTAVAGVAANAALLYHSLHHFTGARFIVSHGRLEGGQVSSHTTQTPVVKLRHTVGSSEPHVTRQRPSQSPPGTPKLRASDPRKMKTPPRTPPQTPWLKPLASPEDVVQMASKDVDDDEEAAFPTSEHESRYEASDDPDEVYSDFSLIFGGPGDSTEDEDEHSYDEYLEELDGIPWSL
jgi:hypothetical protein